MAPERPREEAAEQVGGRPPGGIQRAAGARPRAAATAGAPRAAPALRVRPETPSGGAGLGRSGGQETPPPGCRRPPPEPQGHLARRSGRFGAVETGSLAVSRRWRWWGLQTRRQGPCALVGARPWEVGEMLMNPRDFHKAGLKGLGGKSLALAEATQGLVPLRFLTRCVGF